GISPEDLIRTFGTSTSPYYYPTSNPASEAPAYPGPSPAGFTEAIAGWNFVDNTNDPFDDVQYGHGSGEAEDSTGAADSIGTVVVNSVTRAPSQAAGGQTAPLYNPPGYLFLNGCTNYGANIGVTVESASCSSEATGKAGGITGLIESEARNLLDAGGIAAYPRVTSVGGQPIALSATEVRELIEMSADDVDFQTAALPFGAPDNYAVVSPVPTTRYPT